MNEPRPTPGQRLRAERERRGMSIEKAALDMHLDAWVIDGLESGDYARVGPMVYAKGHMKRYAAILGLPVDEILSEFEPVLPAAPAPERSKFPVGSRHTREPSRIVSPAQTAASLAAVLALIGVVWWQPWHHREPAATAAQAASPGTEAPAPADRDVGPATPEVTAESYAPRALAAAGGAMVATPGAAAPGVATPGANAADPAAAAPARARLRLSFTSDSWVDVRDAQGNRAFVGNGSANTVKTIAGAAPLHVYLRSASGVQLEINGRAVAIGPQFFSGNVARFEAGADGVLRREQTPTRPPG
jgi:cytoskeleton protein RodZ